MNKDTVVGIVGAVILVAAMVGVFKYEGSQAASTLGSQAFEVAWSTASASGPGVSGATDEGASSSEVVEVSSANLTSVRFTLAWVDEAANSEPDSFRLRVVGPGGIEEKVAEGASGELSVVFEGLNEVPADTDFFANDDADAARRLAGQYTKSLGVGGWNVTIELLDAGDLVAGPTGVPLQEDTGNAWELSTTLSTYVPEIRQKAADA